MSDSRWRGSRWRQTPPRLVCNNMFKKPQTIIQSKKDDWPVIWWWAAVHVGLVETPDALAILMVYHYSMNFKKRFLQSSTHTRVWLVCTCLFWSGDQWVDIWSRTVSQLLYLHDSSASKISQFEPRCSTEPLKTNAPDQSRIQRLTPTLQLSQKNDRWLAVCRHS